MQAEGAKRRFPPYYRPEGPAPHDAAHAASSAGTILLLLFLLSAYALVAMLVAVALQVNASKAVELIYYVVAGASVGGCQQAR